MSTTESSPLSEFADYLCTQRERFTQEWSETVRKSPEVPSANKFDRSELADHLPALFDDLSERLRRGDEASFEAAGKDAHAHGKHRWLQGYSITELLREIAIIRALLLSKVFARYSLNHPHLPREDKKKAKAIIHDFFNHLVVDSVEQYVAEQDKTIRAINDELRLKNRELAELDESRMRLIRSVSHELRNILNALTLATTGVAEGENESERQEMLAISQRSLADMAALLNQLLDYSALVEGRDSLNLEQIDLRRLFEEIVSTWRPAVEEKGLKLHTHFDPALGEIISDKLKLRQIAGNLLSNAVKYCRKGQQEGDVYLYLLRIDADTWKMAVEDTGIGMAAEDLEKLFKEFSRIRPTEDISGSGLGLSITKRLVERLGGHIDVSSVLGKGSRFEVTLPKRASLNGS